MKTDKRSEQPTSVLICGNAELLDNYAIKLISEYYNVIVIDESSNPQLVRNKLSRRIHIYNEEMTSDNFRKVMYSYAPNVVWYFSGFSDGGGGLDNEQKKIESLLQSCNENEVQKLIYISSINSLNYLTDDGQQDFLHRKYATQKAFACAATECYVGYLSDKFSLKTITLRVPYIAKKENKNNYLASLFGRIANGEKVYFPYNKEQSADFITAHNLAELLVSVTEETVDNADEYVALSGYEYTYGDLADVLRECESSAKIEFDENSFYDIVVNRKNEAEKLRKAYGYTFTADPFESFSSDYASYKKSVEKTSGFWGKIKDFGSKFSSISLKLLETIALFIVVQLLLRYTTDNVYFKYVDLRLFYVLIIGTVHGMLFGIIAGVLQCISLAFAYAATGVNAVVLFYNTDYWLPFAIYLITGAITGYLVSVRNQKIKFAEEEVYTLQSKYVFLNDVYLSVMDNKDAYKRQILGYKDSFGKIFEAVEKLNSASTADIFLNGITTLEDILENHSIAIYSMDHYQKYLRLVACSRELSNKLGKSQSREGFQEIYDVVKTTETYKNTQFKEGLPIYAYAIVEHDEVRLLVCLYEATPEQLGLYYMNLFTILCNLIRVSFLRALEYQEAIADEKFYKGTDIMLPEFFETELESLRKMSEAGIASFVLLRLKSENIEETDKRLQGLIRQSDIVGRANDGEYYLLLNQTSRQIMDVIGERLAGKGIEYEVVEG